MKSGPQVEKPAPQGSIAATKRRLPPAVTGETACPTKKSSQRGEEIKIL
jgi:hypothetical protein